jgi:hypothetical protein
MMDRTLVSWSSSVSEYLDLVQREMDEHTMPAVDSGTCNAQGVILFSRSECKSHGNCGWS